MTWGGAWSDIAVRGSIAAATLAWAAAEWLRWRRPTRGLTARAIWTVGAGSIIVHAVAVFHYVHHWSHDAAIAHTARQTAALTGLDWGGGLYVNYAFIALWVGDAMLWWSRSVDAMSARPVAWRDVTARDLRLHVRQRRNRVRARPGAGRRTHRGRCRPVGEAWESWRAGCGLRSSAA